MEHCWRDKVWLCTSTEELETASRKKACPPHCLYTAHAVKFNKGHAHTQKEKWTAQESSVKVQKTGLSITKGTTGSSSSVQEFGPEHWLPIEKAQTIPHRSFSWFCQTIIETPSVTHIYLLLCPLNFTLGCTHQQISNDIADFPECKPLLVCRWSHHGFPANHKLCFQRSKYYCIIPWMIKTKLTF